MATRAPRRWGPARRGAPGMAATGGAEPLGTVRRSQLVSTYGIGAIVDLEKGSFMPMGLEDWEYATALPSLRIGESRLQAQLGVDHFRLPPVAEKIKGTRNVEPKRTAPAVRFPAWHECPKCHRLGTEGAPFEPDADGGRLRCVACRTVATPVRFVVACRTGHVEDFPWAWWAHRRRPEGPCASPSLYLRSRGRSAALADLYVECRSCRTDGRPTTHSLGDAFRPESLGSRPCSGWRPWLHDREPGCQSPPKVIQRGASNAHFATVASALSIPPVSEAAFQIVEEAWNTLGAVPAEAVDAVLGSMARSYNVDPALLVAAFRMKAGLETGHTELTDVASRRDEYAALSASRHDPVLGGIVPHFENEAFDPPAALLPWFDLVGAVSRLREVRALAGFSRIEPYPVGGDQIQAAIAAGRIAPLSKTRRNWLPAAEIRGEGIFLRFRTGTIDTWIRDNPALIDRARILDERSARMAAERGYVRDYTITPRLLLVHSFAHALIRQISIDCGYSSSALRERLYVTEADSSAPAMNGVLVYTGSPDSEGSLGGLVRLADPDLLPDIVRRTLHAAGWCGSDPVCLETDPRQSGDRVAGAACHCCLLVPETACEKFNRELDRSVLVGDANDQFEGYFGRPGD